MRLLVEIVIIAAVIFLGWNKPFKEQVDHAYATIESKLNRTGSNVTKKPGPLRKALLSRMAIVRKRRSVKAQVGLANPACQQ